MGIRGYPRSTAGWGPSLVDALKRQTRCGVEEGEFLKRNEKGQVEEMKGSEFVSWKRSEWRLVASSA
jgi:hypothetical protein